MIEPIRVQLIADTPDVIPILANWYKGAWPDWFIDTPLAEIENEFRSVANRDHLPLALAAYDGTSQLLGACSIRDDPFASYPSAGPWLRGLYVHPPFRGQGIAGAMIRAAEQYASLLCISRLYASTHSAIGTFERAGWLGFDQVMHDGQKLTIFAKRIDEFRK